MDGSYPPGVSGWMIDDYFDGIDPVEPPRSCENCTYYEERTCGHICGMLEAEHSREELEAMSDEEYMQKFGKDPDDCCEDHEFWED